MFKNRYFIIALCVVLFAALVALMVCERQNPEAGSELLRSLLNRA